MTPDDSTIHTIHTIHSIAAKRWRIALILSALMLAFYLGFILLGALTIVSCWILNGIYVVWANRVYDDEVAQVLRSRRTS